jgi:hypothetical protein
MFNWIWRLIRPQSRNKAKDFDAFVRIVSQIQQEHVIRKGVRPELHGEFVRLCDEEGFEALPVEGDDQPEATLRTEFHQYFGTRVFGGSRSGREMEIEIGFISDPEFNAWAASRGGVDLIGVNSGLLIVLNAAIRALLSQPYLFPHIGDSTMCKRHVFPREITSLPMDSTMWDTAPLECPAREQLASRIWSIALCYMIEHEFAHVWNGHTDYLAEVLGLARLNEVGDDALGDLSIQALEIDADRSAAIQTLRFALNPTIEAAGNKIKWNLPSVTQSGPTLDIVERCTIAACLFGLLASDVHELESPDYVSSTHPPAIVRMICNLHAIVSALRVFAGHDQSATLSALNPVIGGMIDSLRAVVPGGRWDISSEKLTDQATHLIAIYDSKLLELRPELNRYKRGNYLETENPFYA